MSDDVFRSLRWLTGAKAFAQLISWASTIVVMRLLTPDDYGLVAMAGVFTGFLLFLGDFGLSTALISRRETDEGVLRAAHGVSLLGGTVLCAGMLGAAPFIAVFFGNLKLTALIQFGSILFLAVGLSTVPRAQLAMDMRFREISIAGMAAALLSTLITLCLAWLGYGPWALVCGTVAGGVWRALHLQWYSGRFPRPTLAIARLRGLWRLSWYLVATNSAYYWYEQVDALIVGRRLGDTSLGYLVAGKTVTFTPVSKVAEVTNQVALPAFSRLQHDPCKTAEAYAKAVRLLAVISLPALWGLAVTAPDVVDVLLGPKWQQATLVIQLLSFATPLRLAGSVSSAALQGIGRPDLAFSYTIKTLALSILLLIFGVDWGLTGVSAVWTVSILTSFVLGLSAVTRCVPISGRRIAGDLARAALPAVIMVLCVLFVRSALSETSSAFRLGTCVFVGAVLD